MLSVGDVALCRTIMVVSVDWVGQGLRAALPYSEEGVSVYVCVYVEV